MINQLRRISNVLVNLPWSQLAFLSFHCYYRDQGTVTMVWTGSFFHFISYQRAQGSSAERGAGLHHRGERCFRGPVTGFWVTLVTRLCLLALLSLFVTSFQIRSQENIYQLIDLSCFSETLCNRILIFLCCY